MSNIEPPFLRMLDLSRAPEILYTPRFSDIFGPQLKVVRVPTIGDGNCLFHTILTAVDSDYNKMDYNNKSERATKLRMDVFTKLNEVWTTLDINFRIAMSDICHNDGTLDMSKALNYRISLPSEVATFFLPYFGIDANTALLYEGKASNVSDVNFVMTSDRNDRYQIYIGGSRGHYETLAIWDGVNYRTALAGNDPIHATLISERSRL